MYASLKFTLKKFRPDIIQCPYNIFDRRLNDIKLKIFDPYFISKESFSIKTEKNYQNAIENTDAVMLLTAHKEFFSINIDIFNKLMKNPVVIDTRGVFDISELNKFKITFRGIGRPN